MSFFTVLAELMVGAMMVVPLAWELISKGRPAERSLAQCAAAEQEANI